MTRAALDSTSPRSDASWISRSAVIFEVVGVLVTAILLARLAQTALGFDRWKTVQAEMLASGERDYWRLAELATVEQILKYGFVILIFYLIGRWHRDRRLPAYGLRSTGRSFRSSVAIGFVAWAALGILPTGLQVLAKAFPILGSGPDHWSLFPPSWSPAFLAYMAASSFLLVPIVEEIFARGYLVTRLAEDYGTGGGILLSALYFSLAHTQYFRLEVLSLGMLLSLLLGSIGLGYVFVRTGSLAPVIIAHGLSNVPPPPVPWGRSAELAVMVSVLVFARRPLLGWLRNALAVLSETSWARTGAGALLLGLGLLAVLISGDRLPHLAFALLALALLAHWLDRRATAARDAPNER